MVSANDMQSQEIIDTMTAIERKITTQKIIETLQEKIGRLGGQANDTLIRLERENQSDTEHEMGFWQGYGLALADVRKVLKEVESKNE